MACRLWRLGFLVKNEFSLQPLSIFCNPPESVPPTVFPATCRDTLFVTPFIRTGAFDSWSRRTHRREFRHEAGLS
jgi:hypothetical protein